MRKNEYVRLMILWITAISVSTGSLIGSYNWIRFFSYVTIIPMTLIGIIFFYVNKDNLEDITIPKKTYEIASDYLYHKSLRKVAKLNNIHHESVRREILNYIEYTLPKQIAN